MAKLVQAPPKFVPPEWHQSNTIKYNSAEGQRVVSERLVDESARLIDEVEKTTQRTQREVNKRIGIYSAFCILRDFITYQNKIF